jgi:hypothetical protein
MNRRADKVKPGEPGFRAVVIEFIARVRGYEFSTSM